MDGDGAVEADGEAPDSGAPLVDQRVVSSEAGQEDASLKEASARDVSGSSSGSGSGSSSGVGGGGSGGSSGSSSGSSGGPSFDGCTQVSHDDGLGQHWQDCVPLGTYDLSQATRACESSGAARCVDAQGCGAGNLVVIGYNAAETQAVGIWGYGGLVAGFTSPSSSCPNSASGPTWD